jgi:hypothetical protein
MLRRPKHSTIEVVVPEEEEVVVVVVVVRGDFSSRLVDQIRACKPKCCGCGTNPRIICA